MGTRNFDSVVVVVAPKVVLRNGAVEAGDLGWSKRRR